jgi:hypothetical protein
MMPEIERTVETHDAYVVVEKLGEPGAIAEGERPPASD